MRYLTIYTLYKVYKEAAIEKVLLCCLYVFQREKHAKIRKAMWKTFAVKLKIEVTVFITVYLLFVKYLSTLCYKNNKCCMNLFNLSCI